MPRKSEQTGTDADDDAAPAAVVVSVFGAFQSYALVMMSTSAAQHLLGDESLSSAAPARVLNAVERDIDLLRERAPDLADGALAASAVAMALEIENPYNSATSKSMCQGRLADALKELRALAPPKEAEDGIDQLAAKRAARRDGVAAAADSGRS